MGEISYPGIWDLGGRAFLGILLQELSSSRRSRRQDVRHGNPIRQCRGFNSNGECAVSHHWVWSHAAHRTHRAHTGRILTWSMGVRGLRVLEKGCPWPPPQGGDAQWPSPVHGGLALYMPLASLHWRQCCFHGAPSHSTANKNAVESVQYGVAGSAAFLECQPRSPQATVKWLFQRDPSDRRREVISCAPQSSPWMRESLVQSKFHVGECSVGPSLGQPSF